MWNRRLAKPSVWGAGERTARPAVASLFGALATASLLSSTSLWSFWSLWSLPQSLPLPQASAHALRAAVAQTGTLEAWHPATADGILFLPVLDGLGDGTACDTAIVVQNVGQDISKAALITWSTPGDCPPQSAGPLKVECTGLLKPGTTWTLSGGQVPTGSHSGVLFSFTAKQLSQIGVDLGFDDVAGDYLCELLFFNVIGDSDDARRFLRAYTLGLSFDGVPLDRAAGGAIAAWVGRECPQGTRSPSQAASYRALGAPDVGGYFQSGGTFRFQIPAAVDTAPQADASHHAVYVQNAGLDCATVRLMATAECGRQTPCTVFTLAPGERRTVVGAACGLNVGGTAESDQPLAIVVDSWSVDGALSSLTAETEQRWDGEAWAPRTGTAGGMMLSAPLVYGNAEGWSTGFVIQNLSRATEAEVKILVLDRGGDIIVAHKVGRVCPLGAVTILPSELAKFVPSGFIGAVRIESQRWWLPGTTVADPPRLIGHAFGRSSVDADDGFSYPLVVTGPEVEQRPAAEQVGLLVLPELMNAAADGEPSTHFAVANLSTVPGYTDLAIYLFDQNGLLDYICQKLNDEQVEYIDFSWWEFLNPGFRGSAVISAYFWEHDQFDAKGEWLSNSVHLAVVAAALPRQPHIDPLRPPPALIGGVSPSWAMVGIPLTLLQRPPMLPSPLCPGLIDVAPPTPPRPRITATPHGPAPTQRPTVTGTPPTAVPTPTAPLPPSSTPPHLPTLAHLTYLPAAHRGIDAPAPRATSLPLTGSDAPGEGGPYLPPGDAVFIPVLGLQGADVPDDMAVTSRSWCSSQVHVMNVDTAPISALFVTWYAPGACGDACDESLGDVLSTYTGLLAPGTRWTFSPESVFAHNGAVFSVRGAKLSAIGVADPGDRWIADALGGALSMAFRGCEGGKAYADFKRAWDADGTYAGIPLGQAKGGAIAVEVDRACPGSADAGVRASASYQGVALHDSGVRAGPDVDLTYALPLVYSSVDTFATTLYLQNASSECASVEVVAQARDDCAQDKPCGRFDIPAGHMVPIDTVRCTGTDWQGSFKVHSSRPLAIVADIAGRDILSTYNAEPLDVHDPDLGTESSAGSRVLYGPLTYSEYQGWDTGVQVFNMSDDYAAKIKVYFLDRSGDIVTTLVDWVCPLGSQTFFLPVVNELPGNWVGSVRVESQDWMNPGGSDIPDHNITAIATLIRYERSDRAKAIAGAAYNLLTESDAFDWRLGHGTGGLESGVGLIALPNVSSPGSSGSRTEIAVTNVVPKPGFTRYTVVLFDANGRVDDMCLDVREKQAVYLDLARWSHLGAPFTGSALISATYWQHDVMDDEGGFVRNLVGLTAAVVQRSGAAGVDAPGDELSVSTGVPLRGSGAALWAPLLADAGWRCGFETDHGMLWSPAPALGADAGEAFVPALRAGPAATACAATVTALNLGRSLGTRVGSRDPSEAKVILVAWAPAACPGACAPAVAVRCSGLLGPGGSWRFDASSLPPTAAAATLFSLVPAEADRLCPLLAAAVGTDCGRIAAFVDAYRTAGVFEDVSLELGIGPAIVAEVLRDCPATADASVRTHASYPAITRHDAKAADTQAGSFVYGLPQLGNAYGEGRSVAYVQNAGSACATVTLEFTGVAGCEARTCATVAVPPGGMVRLDAEACRSAGRLVGAGRVISDQPLAIVSETAAPRSLSAYRAVTVRDAATLAFAPVTYSEYQGWDAAIHIQNVDRASAARVKVVFMDRSGDIIDTLTDWICPAGAAVVQLDTVHDLDGHWVGTVRVESMARTDDDGRPVPPAGVASVLRMVQGGDADAADGLSEAVAYNLLTPGFTDTSGLWPAGPLLADGGAVLAVPAFNNGSQDAPGGSELAIANLAIAPGFTDLSLYIFDANGLVDTICQKLNEQQVEYIDLATWGAIGDGFRGSALISAVFWNHPLRDAGGQRIANQLALGAVLAQRIGTTGKVDVPGDELAMTEAWPVELGDDIVRDLPTASCP